MAFLMASLAAKHCVRRTQALRGILPECTTLASFRSAGPVSHHGENRHRAFSSTTKVAPSATIPANDDDGDDMFNSDKRLTEETMSQNLRGMEYAVRGEVVAAADDLQQELEDNPDAFPNFDEILYTNVGNPHSVGQKSLTWPREVMALCNLPDETGIMNPEIHKIFNEDVITRVREIRKDDMDGKGTGSYSHSQGHPWFREDIAAFLKERDGGVPASADDIFMTNGASKGIEMVLETLLADETKGLMLPIPQYPIYSAQVSLRGAHQVGYYLDEEKGWSIDIGHLEEELEKSKEKGIDVVGFVLINPGNPTGQVLSREALHDVLGFCARHNLVVLSDEVYQNNIYDGKEFISAKRAAHEMGLLDHNAIELASFHSTSKGLYGECGHRGGYVEMVGFDEKVMEHFYKLASSGLCANSNGQIMTDLMIRGPKPGEDSYERHEQEKKEIFGELKRKAKMMTDGLNAIPGFSCQPAQGSMYCFPRVDMPAKAVQAAERAKSTPDTLYALSLLRSTGICVVPASGFGQKPGRYGFRTTFLPPEEEMKNALEMFERHHQEFCQKYAD